MLVIRAGNHKMLVRIANREDIDLTASQSDLGLLYLSTPFGRQLVFEILEHLPYSTHGCITHTLSWWVKILFLCVTRFGYTVYMIR